MTIKQAALEKELEDDLLEQMEDDLYEEEEEEEEVDDDLDEDLDRGDEVDPELTDEEADEVDAGDSDSADEGGDELDPEALAEIAGEGKSRSVPHTRFNEVNEQLKTERAERLRLEEELARARGTGAANPGKAAVEQAAELEPEIDLKALRRELREAMYEGDQDKAEVLEEQIEAAQMARMEKLADEKAEARLKARTDEDDRVRAEAQQKEVGQRVAVAAAAAIEKYPFMDEDGADFDADVLDEVLALRDLYMKRGDAPDEAITKAADRVGSRYAPEGETDDRQPAKPSAAQLQRNIARERAIPARGAGLGERANKIDYENLTEDQFDSLPDAEKRKARGDFVG